MAEVSIVKCESYDHAESCIRKAFELIGGIKSFVKPNDRVLLKVNLLLPAKPDAAITTHPEVVRAAAKLFLSAKAEVKIGDSSGGLGRTKEALDVCGISGVAGDLGIKTINFDAYNMTRVEIPKGKVLKEVYLSSALFEADLVVSLPKLKTHALTLYTGAIKNMYGTIPGGRKSQIHAITGSSAEKFAEALVDIYSVAPLHLSLMDGIVGMEGIGPNMGKPRKGNVVLASKNALALDAVASYLIGYSPRDIPTLRIAQERGLGTIDIDKITINGEALDNVRIEFKKPKRIYKGLMFLPAFVRNMFIESPRLPFAQRDKCTGCQLCEKQCPVGAIKVNDCPTFDYEKCIHCYCCYEVCKEGGITLKKSLLPRTILGRKKQV